MKTITFNKSKYEKYTGLDLGKFKDVPFNFNNQAHRTDFYEIFFFEKAEGVLNLDNHIIELKDRLIVFASPFQRRLWQVDRKNIKGHFLIFESQFLENLFVDPYFVFRLQFFYNSLIPPFIEEDDTSFFNHQCAFFAMREELIDLKNDSLDFLRAFLLLILAGINRKYAKKYNLSADRISNTTAFKFKQVVEEKIKTLQTVNEYSQLLGISRVSLNRLIKQQFNISASQFIKNRLLLEIKRELLYSLDTISEIAIKLNFSDSSSLIRFFKNSENQSPLNYRISYQNAN